MSEKKKNKSFGVMGSMATISWVRDQIRLKRFKLPIAEKFLLLALADSPATVEYLISEYDLKPAPTEKALERLLLKGLLYYPDGDSNYKYAVFIPED